MIKYTPITVDEFKKRLNRKPQTSIQVFLKDFEKSEHDVICIDWLKSGYVSAKSCNSSFVLAIKRSGYNMKCIMNDEKIYLYKAFKIDKNDIL